MDLDQTIIVRQVGFVNGGLELTLFRRIGIDPLVAC
ncbi:Uncharacterised protein [Mycobacteroides abscessus subsp. abscessus]|nr:Uncharacterised protein [Mycobacteroides abscessus subsp. abscessus]